MIDPKELRIGNWLTSFREIDHSDYLVQVIEIKTSWFRCQGDEVYPSEEDEITGIEINADTLLKCGFIDPAGNGWGYRKDLHPGYTEVCFYMQDGFLRYQSGIKAISGYTTQLPHIKYIHQLQNFWHAMTGEELIYKP